MNSLKETEYLEQWRNDETRNAWAMFNVMIESVIVNFGYFQKPNDITLRKFNQSLQIESAWRSAVNSIYRANELNRDIARIVESD